MSLDPQQTAQLRAPVGPKASFDAAKVRGLHGYDETSDCPTICPGDGLDYKRSIVHPSDVPAASPLSGSETITALQGSGLVRTTIQAIADLVGSGLYQPLDADLTAIAALSTQAFGRSLLTATDAAAARTAIGAAAAPAAPYGVMAADWSGASPVPRLTVVNVVPGDQDLPVGAPGDILLLIGAAAVSCRITPAGSDLIRLNESGVDTVVSNGTYIEIAYCTPIMAVNMTTVGSAYWEIQKTW